MTKKSLGSGLEGWIKDTKKSHDRLSRDPDPRPDAPPDETAAQQAAVAPQIPRSEAEEKPVSEPPAVLRVLSVEDIEVPAPRLPIPENEDLEWLKASLFRDGQLQPVVVRTMNDRPVLVTGYRRLKALKDLGMSDVTAIVHPELSDDQARKLYLSDNLARIQADPSVLRDLIAAVGPAEVERWGIPSALIDHARHLDEPPDEEAAASDAPPAPVHPGNAPAGPLLPGILEVTDDTFDHHVLDASEPVMVAVHLAGRLGSDEVQQAMLEAKERWGDVKLCALDILSCDGPAVPQLIKVGRGFLQKGLPRVLIFHGGFQRREIHGVDESLDADTLVAWLDEEAR